MSTVIATISDLQRREYAARTLEMLIDATQNTCYEDPAKQLDDLIHLGTLYTFFRDMNQE